MKHLLNGKALYGAVKVAATIAVGLMVLAGCRNPLDSRFNQREEIPSGTGTLALTVNERGAGRTIMPALPGGDYRFFLEFECETGVNENFGASWNGQALIELQAGRWLLRVTSYIPQGNERLYMARSGWVPIEVAPGVIVEENIMLVPLAEGYGTFRWDFGFSANVATAGMRVERIDGGTPAFDRNFTLAVAGAAGVESLPVGVYRVTFTLGGRDGENAQVSKILHVHRNLQSFFADDDGLFANFIFPADLLRTILGAWTEAGWNFDLGDGRRIAAGHFGLLEIRGVGDVEFSDLVERFNELTSAANRPADMSGLQSLVDTALVRLALADPTRNRANNEWGHSVGAATIRDHVRNVNPETVGIAWGTGEQYYNVTVTIGGFGFSTAFVPVEVTGITIEGSATHFMTIHDAPLALTATLVPPDARNQGISWTVHEPGGTTATVSANGVVSPGTTDGAALIRATSVGNPYQYATVTVNVSTVVIPIEGLEIYNADFDLNVGEYKYLTIVFTPADTNQRGLDFSGSPPGRVTLVQVDYNLIRVTGAAVGPATVTVTSESNPDLSDTVEVNVIAIPIGVEVTGPATMPRNRAREFEHYVDGPPGVTQDVEWTIDPPSLGTIDSNGRLTLYDDASITGTGITVTATVTAHGVTKSGYTTVMVGQAWPDTITINDVGPVTVVYRRDPYHDTTHGATLPAPRRFTATILPPDASPDIEWSIEPITGTGMVAGAGMDPNDNGLLSLVSHPLVHDDRFIVRARATGYPDTSFEEVVDDRAEVAVNVKPTGVVIVSGYLPGSISRGANRQFTARVDPTGVSPGIDIVWTVSLSRLGVNMGSALGVDMGSATGLLTTTGTADLNINDLLTIRATAVPGDLYDEAELIVAVSPDGVDLITEGDTNPTSVGIHRGFNRLFETEVRPDDASEAVEWRIEQVSPYPVPPDTWISINYAAGTLTVTVPYGATPGQRFIVRVWPSGFGPDDDDDQSVSTIVEVTIPPPTGVTVTPTSATMIRGGGVPQTFNVTVAPEGAVQDIVWDALPANYGSFTGNVLTIYPGATIGNLTVTARTTGATVVSGSATVNVVRPVPTNLNVTPTNATIVRPTGSQPPASAQFTASMSQPAGVDIRSVGWRLDPSDAGTISATVFNDAEQTATITVTLSAADTAVSSFRVIAEAGGYEMIGGVPTPRPANNLANSYATVQVQEQGGFVITRPDFPDRDGGIEIPLPGPSFNIIDGTGTITVDNTDAFVPRGESGIDTVQWFFNDVRIGSVTQVPAGNSHASGAHGQVLNLTPRMHGALLSVGRHFVTVEVVIDGQLRSRRVEFEILMIDPPSGTP